MLYMNYYESTEGLNVTNSTFTNIFLRANSIIQLEKERVRKKTCSDTPRPVPSFQPCFFNSCIKQHPKLYFHEPREKELQNQKRTTARKMK